jgi:hypothetical protein
MTGVYRVLLEDRSNPNKRIAYFNVGTLKNGKLTHSKSPEGIAITNDPTFPTALEELREFATIDSVMSD